MLNQNKLLAAAVTVLLSGFVLSGNVIAHPDSESGEHKVKHMKKMHKKHGRDFGALRSLRRAFGHLDLSDEQKDSLKSLKENNKDTMKASKVAMKPLKKQMHELLSAESLDETAIKDLSIQIAEKKADHMILMASIKKQAIALLTDEQRVELKKMKQKREKKMREHSERS